MCCGLPMLPNLSKANSGTNLSNNLLDKYNATNIINKPINAKQLKELAGPTQCDHILPLSMMFFGLKSKSSNNKLPNIGIGSNYVPLHSSCNLKKSNITPEAYWKKNSAQNVTDYNAKKWNTEWGDQNYPNGPWGVVPGNPTKTLENINSWCKNNNWAPKKYARLLQWKYFSVLDFLVNTGNDGDFRGNLQTLFKRAKEIFDNVNAVKKKFGNILNEFRGDLNKQNLGKLFNLLTDKDVAGVFNLTQIGYKANLEKSFENEKKERMEIEKQLDTQQGDQVAETVYSAIKIATLQQELNEARKQRDQATARANVLEEKLTERNATSVPDDDDDNGDVRLISREPSREPSPVTSLAQKATSVPDDDDDNRDVRLISPEPSPVISQSKIGGIKKTTKKKKLRKKIKQTKKYNKKSNKKIIKQKQLTLKNIKKN